MATTDDAEKPKRRPKTTKKVADEQLEDEPSSYPKPDDGPDAPVSAESRLRAEQRRAMKTKTSRKIRVRRAKSVPDSVIRKPTQPSLPVCRRVVIELWNARNRTAHEREYHPRHESSPASVLSTYSEESSIGPNCRRRASLLVGDGSRMPKSWGTRLGWVRLKRQPKKPKTVVVAVAAVIFGRISLPKKCSHCVKL